MDNNFTEEIKKIVSTEYSDLEVKDCAFEYIDNLITKLQVVYMNHLSFMFKDVPRDDKLLCRLFYTCMPPDLASRALDAAKNIETIFPVEKMTRDFNITDCEFNLSLTSSIECIICEVLDLVYEEADFHYEKSNVTSNLIKSAIMKSELSGLFLH